MLVPCSKYVAHALNFGDGLAVVAAPSLECSSKVYGGLGIRAGEVKDVNAALGEHCVHILSRR